MEDPSDQKKLFVGGVSWETTEESLKEHFGKYGTVLASAIAKDRVTRSSRGFAFITFSDASGVELALQDSHEIGGRTVRSEFFSFLPLLLSVCFVPIFFSLICLLLGNYN